jgi:hypothetical protein
MMITVAAYFMASIDESPNQLRVFAIQPTVRNVPFATASARIRISTSVSLTTHVDAVSQLADFVNGVGTPQI